MSNKLDPDVFWFENFYVLIDPNKVIDFYPSFYDSEVKRLNSIVRLSFYVSIVLSVYHKNYNFFYILLAALLVTYAVYKQKEHLENTVDVRTVPTYENPFMNFTMSDYLNLDKDGNIKAKPKIQDPLDPKVAQDIESKLNQGTFRDVSDIFNKNGSQRQFFTMPWTDPVNDREEFQNWLYKTGETCKENSKCLRYEDVRAKKFVFGNPDENPSKIMKGI